MNPQSHQIKFLRNDTNEQEEILLTRQEAADYLGTESGTLAIWACTGRYKLPYVKIGRLVKYRLSDLNAFIERQTQGKSAQ